MTRDVSLCIIRVERSEFLREADDACYLPLKTRGQRKTREIRIETYIPQETSASSSVPSSSQAMSEDAAGASGLSQEESSPPTKDSIHFISGNPFVETTHGVLHLFKEDELTDIERAAKKSQTVCILAVPSTMTCTDLLNFIAACYDDIKHVRIIKDGSPHQYMALITFRSSKSVVEFYKSFNGIPFNNMEPDWCCHLVFVSRIEAIGENEGGSLPPPSHTELPTCPVCLERMDESVDGILTILCNHAFHGNCLTKWGDTSCPVCRYVQTPEPSADSYCLECLASESLWICLICGHVGCGRYLHGHAYQHYKDTNHCYSMQLGNNSVWDYVGDNFVHRILQNKTDGKLVEGPNPDKPDVKIDSLQLEFTNLLTSQLESQRVYYEDMVKGLRDMIQTTVSENSTLEITSNQSAHEKHQLEKKLQVALAKLSQSQKELSDEKELCQALQDNQKTWKQKYTQLEKQFSAYKETTDKEITDLKEQLRDVMFALEAENAINQSSQKEEIRNGKIELGEASCSQVETKKTRARGRKLKSSKN